MKIFALILITIGVTGLIYVQSVDVPSLVEVPEAVYIVSEAAPENQKTLVLQPISTTTESLEVGDIHDDAVTTLDELAGPTHVNLDVPFQPQAPYANWAAPYDEACEEASLIMVDHFYRGEDLSAFTMDNEIHKLYAWESQNGYPVDTSIREMTEVSDHFYDYEHVILDPLIEENIKEQLNLGRPVIMTAAGRDLRNPYFTPPGPLYHVLLIKGYTEDGHFIANDPGTRHGHDYLYDADVLLNAAHDWTGSGPGGPPRGLVLINN